MGYRLKHIDFAYPGRPIFTDLGMALAAGCFHGIIGPNGCGKSTLLDLLGGLKRPDRGQITWKEDDLADQPPKFLAQKIALVPQDFHIDFPFTAGEVVTMGRYPHLARFEAPSAADREKVAAVMARTDTETFAERRITELSGGERQRVIFARALAQETEVLLLDEATSALDINHSLRLLAIAAGGVKKIGLTVIAVFQDKGEHCCYVEPASGGKPERRPVKCTLPRLLALTPSSPMHYLHRFLSWVSTLACDSFRHCRTTKEL